MTLPQRYLMLTATVLTWTCLLTSPAQAQAVEVTDPNVEAAIRAEIGKATGDLTEADLLKVVELDLSNKDLSTLTLPDGLTNLEVLDLSLNKLAATLFSPIRIPADLTSLHTLLLNGNNLSSATSLSFLSTLPALQTLDLRFNARTSLVLPDNLRTLITLDASNNNLTELVLPEGPSELVTLIASFNELGTLTIPPGYTKLEEIFAVDSGLTEFNLSDDLTSLVNVEINNNELTSLTIPAGLSNLQFVIAYRNQLEEVNLPADLRTLQRLDLEFNQLEEFTFPLGLDVIEGILLRDNPLTTIYIPEYLESRRDYFEIFYPDAEIIIIVMDPEFTSLTRLEGGEFELILTGRESTYVIYRSTDLIEWTELEHIISVGSRTVIVDEEAVGEPAVFYRFEEIEEPN